jgi:CTP synthase (UTP-ammonia lyase)
MNHTGKIRIGIIGDFDGRSTHLATQAALHDAARGRVEIEVEWLGTRILEDGQVEFEKFSAFVGAPGAPYQSADGALHGIRYARERSIPFLGTCGGFQHAVIEFVQSLDPSSTIEILEPLACDLFEIETEVQFLPQSRIREIYGSPQATENFRCHYGLTTSAREALLSSQMQFTGVDIDNQVVVVELQSHPFFIGTLFQPQLASSKEKPHPLFRAFLKTAMAACE